MAEQEEPKEGKKVRIVWGSDENIPVHYANHLVWACPDLVDTKNDAKYTKSGVGEWPSEIGCVRLVILECLKLSGQRGKGIKVNPSSLQARKTTPLQDGESQVWNK